MYKCKFVPVLQIVFQCARSPPGHSAVTQDSYNTQWFGESRLYIHMMAVSSVTELWQRYKSCQDLEGPKVQLKFFRTNKKYLAAVEHKQQFNCLPGLLNGKFNQSSMTFLLLFSFHPFS